MSPSQTVSPSALERLKSKAIEKTPNGLVIADASGHLIHVNPAFLRLFGLAQASQAVGRHLREFWPAPEADHGIEQALETQGQWKGEMQVRREADEVRTLRATVRQLPGPHGEIEGILAIFVDLSKRKRAEEALQQSEARLRALYDAAREGILVAKAAQPGFVMANPAICQMLGHTEAELLKMSPQDIHPPEHFHKVIAHFEAMSRGEFEMNQGMEVLRKDGSVFYADISVAPLEIEGTQHFVGVFRDTTEVHEARKALAHSEDNLKEAQHIAQLGSWELDLASGDLHWSDEVFRIFELDPAHFGASFQGFIQAIHPEDREFVQRAYTDSVAHGTAYDIVHRIQLFDGRIKYVRERCRSFYDEAGKPIRSVGTIQDITELRKTEQTLQDLNRNLEQRVRDRTREIRTQAAIIDQVQDAIVTLNRSGQVESWNQGAERMFGHTHESMRGRHIQTLLRADDIPSLDGTLFNPALQHGKREMEIRMVRKDGTVFDAHLSLSLRVDEMGAPQGMIAYIIDISQRKQVERELRRAKDEAEQASRLKSEFLSSMSHELRTPLNAILGFAELLQMSDKLDEHDLSQLREISQAGRHLLNLVNDVLDLAKIESDQIDLTIEATGLVDILNDCRMLLLHQAAERQIQLDLMPVGVKEAYLLADQLRLKQVLLNLLNNAVKYNRRGGSVQVSLQSVAGGYMRIAIRDTGQGIPAAKLPELFTQFNRLGLENGNIQGTGIGLVITKRLVEMMDGRIGVDSQVDHGSTFWIELPTASHMAIPKEPPSNDSGAESPPLAKPPRPPNYCVLYVEDNPGNVRLMERILDQRPDIRLVVATTPKDGEALALSETPDLILLDINLPEMDGYALLQRLRLLPLASQPPVIAVTANAMKGDEETGLAAGFAAYITKPLDIPSFYKLLDSHLPASPTHERHHASA